jgi:hypothetical protein
VPLCSARREELSKSRGIVDNISTNNSFIFIFPYSSRVAACVLLGNFTSKSTHERAKQGERGNDPGNQATSKERERKGESKERECKYLFTHSNKYMQHNRCIHQAITKHDVITSSLLISFNSDYTKIKKHVKQIIFPTCCAGMPSGVLSVRFIRVIRADASAMQCDVLSKRFKRAFYTGVAAKRYRLQHVHFKRMFHADVATMQASDSSERFMQAIHAGVSCKLFAIASIVLLQVICYCKYCAIGGAGSRARCLRL